jgi:DNA-binding NtrC family response regulator
MNQKLLVVDDDPAGCRLLKALFTEYDISTVSNGKSCLVEIETNTPNVVILDLQLPDINGIDILEKIRRTNPSLPVIMLTAYAELKTAIRAMQLGAFDYLTKPINQDEIIVVVRRALEKSELLAEVKDLRRQLEGGSLVQQMGPSLQIQRIADQVQTVAASNFSVLILGETGTGKELIAQAIHRQSPRRGKSFVALDCGAIPDTLLESELFGYEKGAFTGADRRKEGYFHLAEGGTLFLDEVGNLPLLLQAKLLRVMESKQVQAVGATKTKQMDIRFVAATNQDLQKYVAKGEFRSDLYFRFAQYTINVPSLRDRPEDIPHLAQRFLEEASLELRHPISGIHSDVIALLQKYQWPGNVRELRNVIRHAVLETKDLVIHHDLMKGILGNEMDKQIKPSSTFGKSLKEVADTAARDAERQFIIETLQATHGNKSEAARTLKTDYKTLHTKIKNLGITS